MHYRLDVGGRVHVGVKLPYDVSSLHETELVVHETRGVLEMPGYGVARIRGFPMDAGLWRKGDCLLVHWGAQGCRTDLSRLGSSHFAGGRAAKLLRGAAENTVLAYCLGLSDRAARNLVWDERDEVLISTDHESLVTECPDFRVLRGMSSVLSRFLGDGRNGNPATRDEYARAFMQMWSAMARKRATVAGILRRHGWDPAPFESRIRRGPASPPGRVPDR